MINPYAWVYLLLSVYFFNKNLNFWLNIFLNKFYQASWREYNKIFFFLQSRNA